MSDQLKEYIAANRQGFDVHEPGPVVWAGIDQQLQQPSTTIKTKKFKHMFKYGFGASALVIGSLAVFHLVNTPEKTAHRPAIQAAAPAPLATPSVPQEKSNITIKAFRLPRAVALGNIVTSAAEAPNEAVPIAPLQSPPATFNSVPEKQPASADSQTIALDLVQSSGLLSFQNENNTIDTLFNGVKKLEVNSEFCEINIVSHPDDADHAVKLNGHFGNKKPGKSADLTIRYERAGDHLKITIETEKKNHVSFSLTSSQESSVLNLDVPLKTDITAHSSSGSIRFKKLAGKDLHFTSDFGNLAGSDVNSDIRVNSSSGNISLNNIKGNITAKSDFGNLKISHAEGDLNLSSNSGNVSLRDTKGNGNIRCSFGNLRLDSITGNMDIVSSSGNMAIHNMTGSLVSACDFGKQTLENVNGNIKARTNSGSIVLDNTKGKLELNTSFGNITGKGVRLTESSSFDVSSGHLKIDLLNDMKELRFELQTSSGKITVNKEDVKDTSDQALSIGKGAILVKGTSTFGNQVFN
jgi:DUF4097 and DUF4098 domain-containing protein YvlB